MTPRRGSSDPGPLPAPDDPAPGDEPGAARNRSEDQPIEEIFKRIAQRVQVVPKSVEPGVSYQAVHTPPPSRSALLEAPVVLNITTDPATRVEVPEEAAGVPGRSRRPAVLALAVLAVVVIVGLGVLLARPPTSTTGSAGPGAQSVRPSAAAMVPAPPALSEIPAVIAVAPSATSAAPVARPAPQRAAAPTPRARKSEISDDPAGL